MRWEAGTHRSMWRPKAPLRFTHLTTQELRARCDAPAAFHPEFRTHVTSTTCPPGMHGVLSSQDPVGQSISSEIGQSVHLLRVSS
eukprot:COSAG02_NODE_15373_length_1176_cov_2.160631_2_plen_85_part_00